jgi:hypothetical protein
VSDSQLTEALQAQAIAEAAVPSGPLPEPTPLQSNVPNAAAPDLRVVDAAVGDGVTVDDGEEPVSFEDAYLAETLGTELAPDDEQGEAQEAADPDTGLTPEQARIAELEAQIAQVEAQRIIDAANSQWVSKWNEGKTYFQNLEDQVRDIGQREGKTEGEIERAVNRVLLDEQDWDRRFFLSREVGLLEAERSARGVDAISTLIKETGLTNADRPKLAQFATNPEQMQIVAQLLKAERDAVAARDGKIRQRATRNVAEAQSRQQITPAGPTGAPRKVQRVTGSDAELDFMVKNRPTVLRQRSA